MTQTDTTPSLPAKAAGASPDPAADSETLMHLHKMSTTAGLGSQDYVAVNVTSVVAVLFGLASLLAIASPVLLIFPIVGVALSIVALRQVNNSNGTQTGKGLAVLGLILSAAITTVIFSYQGWQIYRRQADQKAIADLIVKYGDCLNQHKFAEAYDLFDSDFQNRVPKQLFIIHLTDIQNGQMSAPIESISWNGLAEFHVDDADTGTESADSVMKLHYKGMSESENAIIPRMPIRFKRVGASPWLIDNIPDQFPATKAPGQR
jgi:hypothetical protein